MNVGHVIVSLSNIHMAPLPVTGVQKVFLFILRRIIPCHIIVITMLKLHKLFKVQYVFVDLHSIAM